jgi:DNA-binding transcriptional LysR family regulator
VRWLRGELGGRLTIGLTPVTAFLPMLGAAVSEFRQSDPGVELQVLELRPHQIREGLREGVLDIGVLHQIGADATPALGRRVLGRMPILLAARGRRGAIKSYAELSQEAWLTSDPADDPAAFLSRLAEHFGAAPPQRVTRCSAISLYYDLALRLDVVTHWAEPVRTRLQPAFDAGLLTHIELETTMPELFIILAFEDEDLLSPAARNFVRLLSRLAEDEFGRDNQ